ncbi:HAD-IIA family hydrolase [Phenylobacterium sp.]|uniref:HAD-IIA family hydrolase n=1 Tax=Phenylobacterium sp. TaxID=1871053 RepID=UPI0035B37B95
MGFARLLARARAAEAVLADWDGCLALGDRLQPGALELVQASRAFAIVSNNSSMTTALFRRKAAEQGLVLPAGRIHLAGEALVREAARRLPGGRVWMLAAPVMREAAEAAGLVLDPERPEAVLVLRDERFDYARLEHAARLVAAGARFWVSNLDGGHPGLGGVTPETGALAAAIQAASGKAPDLVAGKPYPAIFRQALASVGCEPGRALMIGDNPRTDIAGARRVGVPAVRVDLDLWPAPPAEAAPSEPLETRAR